MADGEHDRVEARRRLGHEGRDLGHQGSDQLAVAEGCDQDHGSVRRPDQGPQGHVGDGHFGDSHLSGLSIGVLNRTRNKRITFL